MDWFLYDRDLRQERVKAIGIPLTVCSVDADVGFFKYGTGVAVIRR